MTTPSSGADEVAATGYRQELRRSLRLFDLVVYGLVFIVPGAPISVFGIVFNASAGMVPLIYVVGLVAMLFTASSYATMSAAFPIAGSVYAYAGRAIGARVGFLVGWLMLLDYLLTPALIYVLSAVAVHAVLPAVPKLTLIVGFVSVNALIGFFGIETTARASLVMLALQMIGIVAFMVVAIIGVHHGVAHAQLTMRPFFDAEHISPQLVFGALSLAMLSFLGFDAISTLAEEARDGARAVGRATFVTLLVTGSIFVMLTYTASLFVPGRTHFAPGDATEAAFYDIALLVGGGWLKWLLTVPGALFSGLPGALAAQVATARLLYSMARDGRLPRALAHVDPRSQVPARANHLVSLISLVLGVVMASRLELLASMINFGALCGFLVLHVSVFAHVCASAHVRARGLDARGVRQVGVAAIGMLLIGYVLANLNATAREVGLAWLAIGACVLLFQRTER